MLYCTTCRTLADEGDTQCRNCKNGFVSELACSVCRHVVQRGDSTCRACARGETRTDRRFTDQGFDVVPPRNVDLVPHSGVTININNPSAPPPPPPLPLALSRHLPAPLHVPDSYHVDKQRGLGITAEVFNDLGDVDIMNKMGSLVVLLHAMADEMAKFRGHMESTRRCMRSCRVLAADLQEEIEVRRGSTR